MADDKNTQRLAADCSTAMHAKDAAAQMLGIRIDRIGPGHAELSMTVRSDMLNGHDVCHGGIIFSLADTAFAHACNSYNQVTLAMSAAVDYVLPAIEDDVLTATAQERSRRGRTGVYDVDVSNQKGQLVATFRGRSYSTREALLEETGP